MARELPCPRPTIWVNFATKRQNVRPVLCFGTRLNVFGEGGAGVVVFIGEQPGDQEDKVGKPFVGPAGKYWIGR
jgi:uracil-DNA glycosylase